MIFTHHAKMCLGSFPQLAQLGSTDELIINECFFARSSVTSVKKKIEMVENRHLKVTQKMRQVSDTFVL